jgi:hypothetical protein
VAQTGREKVRGLKKGGEGKRRKKKELCGWRQGLDGAGRKEKLLITY